MADASDARLPPNASISVTALPRDRLSLLPNELLDTIYSLVFQFEDGPWTLHVKKGLDSSGDRPDFDRDHASSILALPRDRRNVGRLLGKKYPYWPDHVEEAFFRALEWGYRNMVPSPNELIAEIIYDLTGVRSNRRQVSSYIQVLKGWIRDMEPLSQPVLRDIRSFISEIQDGNVRDEDDSARMFHIVEEILPDQLNKLMRARMEESEMDEPVPQRPLLDFGFPPPIITPNAEVFRFLSTIASMPNNCYPFFLSTHALSTHALANDILLSPTLINRFHRTNSLAVLASNLVYDMGDNIKAITTFDNPSTGFSIKRVRLTFVEGYMQVPFIRKLARGSLLVLPNLNELLIELWPRDPTRENKEDRSWGDQTVGLLEALGEMKARVVIAFRWKIDCERFEIEYVGTKGWEQAKREEGDLVETNEDMCRVLYVREGR